MRAQPHQVRLDARELVEQHADGLGALRDLERKQLLDRQAVGQVVGHRGEIVDAVGQRHHLLVELRLAGFLNTGVQITDIRRHGDDGFSVNLEHQPKNTVRRRVLRTHVENHGLVLRGILAVACGIGDDVFNIMMRVRLGWPVKRIPKRSNTSRS